MLSISKVSVSHTEYFTKDDYYTKEPGQWQGKGAEALGLTGDVKKEDFRLALQGYDKAGNQLVESQKGKENHRAGLDLAFSAPKSVSIMAEVVGDSRFLEIHQNAVSRALTFVEKSLSEARVTEGGVTRRVQTGTLVISKFDHHTSRALDCALHTHSVIKNMSLREDGKWRALSNEKIFENRTLISLIYKNELVQGIRNVGFEVEIKKNMLFDIKGIDPALIKEFSTRREQIERALNGREGAKLSEKIALMTRNAKVHDVDREALKRGWIERAAQYGYTPERIRENALEAGKKIEKDISRHDHLKEAVKSLEIQASVWSKEEVMKIALKYGLSEGITLNRLEKQIQQALENRDLVQLDINKYSSLEAIKTERQIIDLVQSRHGAFPSQNPDRIDSFMKEQSHLNTGQRAVVFHIVNSSDGVIGINGPAGTGKTTAMRTANQYLEKEGFNVTGMAFTGRAAELLETESGIKSQTIHSFLANKERSIENQSGNSKVWIVDESSMVGNQLMLNLLKAAEREQAKVVLIGDQYQLQAIDGGKGFQMLQEQKVLSMARLEENLRAKTGVLKEINHVLTKERDTDAAINLLEKINAIKEVPDRNERLKAVAEDYLSLSSKEMKNTLVVTARNQDRLEINQYIREGLKEKGELHRESEQRYLVSIPKRILDEDRKFGDSYEKGDAVRFTRSSKTLDIDRGKKGTIQDIQGNQLHIQMDGSGRFVTVNLDRFNGLEAYSRERREFAPGDKVMFLRNDRELGVVNGSMGSVIETGNNTLKIETRNGNIKEVDLKSYGHLDHAYGTTIFKSQGMTSERVLIHIDTSQTSNNSARTFYVGASRASHHAAVYTDSMTKLPNSVRQWQEKESTMDFEKGKVFDFDGGKQLDTTNKMIMERSNDRGVER